MMTVISAMLASSVLTFLMLLVASMLATHGWTQPGMKIAFGNRDVVPERSVLAARADRAARNMVENMAIFAPVGAVALFSGQSEGLTGAGATLFVIARLVYWPLYLSGVSYLRTLAWAAALAGVAMMIWASL